MTKEEGHALMLINNRLTDAGSLRIKHSCPKLTVAMRDKHDEESISLGREQMRTNPWIGFGVCGCRLFACRLLIETTLRSLYNTLSQWEAPQAHGTIGRAPTYFDMHQPVQAEGFYSEPDKRRRARSTSTTRLWTSTDCG